MNALVKADRSMPLAYDDIERLAASIAKSGLFGIKTADQAVALMMIASAEGRHPALAARDYDIINGKPSKKAEAMLRDFLDGGGKVVWNRLDDTIADATFVHPTGGTARITWDMERATKAGLAGKGDMYKKFPRQMLRSRTVSEGVRTVWPLATSGMYVQEEVADFTGPTIDAEPEAPSASPEREAINSAVPLRAAATAMPRAPSVSEPPKRTRAQFLDGLEIALRDALKEPDPAEAVDRIVCGDEVMRAKSEFRNGHIERLNRLITNALVAVTPEAPSDAASDTAEELPEIVGEQRVHAG